jgi:hypothetical protein
MQCAPSSARSFIRAAAAAFIGHRDREAEVDGYDIS